MHLRIVLLIAINPPDRHVSTDPVTGLNVPTDRQELLKQLLLEARRPAAHPGNPTRASSYRLEKLVDLRTESQPIYEFSIELVELGYSGSHQMMLPQDCSCVERVAKLAMCSFSTALNSSES